MDSEVRPIVALFAFANDRYHRPSYLRDLATEQRLLREAMAGAERTGHCRLIERSNTTLDEIADVLADPAVRDRLAIFHFGGHAITAGLKVESAEDQLEILHSNGLAGLLGEQRGLILVFLNSCATANQVEGLLDAGVAGVIATSQAIEDEVATKFAARFYSSLGSGAPIGTALREAEAALRARYGEDTRRAYRTGTPERSSSDKADRWPWRLYVGDGARQRVEHWSLPLAARDPLFGLPTPTKHDLPACPYKHLHSFTCADAEIFFGRGREIREIFEAVTRPGRVPIVMLFGGTGAGKSSLLEAGLRPRLETSHEVLYLRRDPHQGLAGSLASALKTTVDDLGEAWRAQEARGGRPLTVILDQVEEVWSQPRNGSGTDEAGAFSVALRALFGQPRRRPRGRIILAFRKEWLAEALRLLEAEVLPYDLVEVGPLARQGVIEAVLGSERIRNHYGLEVEAELPEAIASDLMVDRVETLAPALQILLTEMWRRASAEAPAAPRFTFALYEDMKRRGLLLEDFLEGQLKVLESWRPQLVRSGLVLDLLAYHTTSLGTAEAHPLEAIVERYDRRPEVLDLLRKCRDLYLLTGTFRLPTGQGLTALRGVNAGTAGTVRLAHDTLAPLVRRRFESSDLPGQRAYRILNQRTTPLAEDDLRVVEAGQQGLRRLTPAEEQVVRESLVRRERRVTRLRALRWFGTVAVLAFVILALVASVQWRRAAKERLKAEDRARVAIATSLLEEDPTGASLVLLEVDEAEANPYTLKALYKALDQPLITNLPDAMATEVPVVFNHDGSRLLTRMSREEGFQLSLWSTTAGERLFDLGAVSGNSPWARFRPGHSELAVFVDGEPLKIFDTTSGRLKSTLWLASRELAYAWFSPDGERLLLLSNNGAAQILDPGTGERFGSFALRLFKQMDPSAELFATEREERRQAYLPIEFDGQRVAAVTPEGVYLWDAATGETLGSASFPTATPLAVGLVSDGTLVLLLSKESPPTAWLWDLRTRQVHKALDQLEQLVSFARFSPDGSRLAIVSSDGSADLYNTATGKRAFGLATAGAERLVFDTSGETIVIFSEDAATLWEATSGRLVMRVPESEVMPSPDASKVVAKDLIGTKDHNNTSLQIWHPPTGAQLSEQAGLPCEACRAVLEGTPKREDGTVISPTRTRMASADQGKVEIRAAGGTVLAHVQGRNPEFSPDGERLLTLDSQAMVRIWDAIDGQELLALRGHENRVLSARFSSDGAWIITASADGTARLWNARNGSQVAVFDHAGYGIQGAAFHPSGGRIVTQDGWFLYRYWAFDAELLRARIRSGTNLCLRPEFRSRSLDEDRDRAWSRFEHCETCLGRCPLPQLREEWLGETPGQALTAYRACQEQLRRNPPPDRSAMPSQDAWRNWQMCVR